MTKFVSDSGNLEIKVDLTIGDPLKQVLVFNFKGKPIEIYLKELVTDILDKKLQPNELDTLIDEICVTSFKFNNDNERYRVQHNFFERIYKNVILVKSKDGIFHINEPIFATIIRKIVEWEKKNKPSDAYHKGTAFFWMAEFYLSQRNFDAAFNHFAQAIEEDKLKDISTYRNKGGYKAASLLDTGHSAVRFLQPIIDKLKESIEKYRRNYSSAYSYDDFKTEFLLSCDPKIEILKFYFTRTFSHLCDFIYAYEDYLFSGNKLISTTLMHYLFGLSVIFEKLLRIKWSLVGTYSNDSLHYYVFDLCNEKGWITSNQSRAISSIYGASSNWEQNNSLIEQLINLNFTSVIVATPIPIEGRLLFANKLIRNLGAHNLIDNPLIAENYKEILFLICHSYFLILEKT